MTRNLYVDAIISNLMLVHAINPKFMVEQTLTAMHHRLRLECLLKAPSLWDEDETLP